MVYRIDVENGTDRGTIVPDVGFKYSKLFNQVNEADIKISGTGVNTRGLMTSGSKVYIYKDGVLEFKGFIDSVDYFLGGAIGFHASGWEVWLANQKGTYSQSPWKSEPSANIFSDIINESSYINVGTIETGFDIDYRLSDSNSIWNGIGNLAKKTTQEISMDYNTDEISILNHIGSSTSVGVFNSGIDILNVRKTTGYPRGNYIKVFGKGDGNNQVTGIAQDAASISTYGKISMTLTDKSCGTDSECERLAEAELAMQKNPPIVLDFELANTEYRGLSLGDIITINAKDQDVINQEFRIVALTEGEKNGNAYITLQVVNPELKTLMLTKNKYIASLYKSQTDDNSYMNGNSITSEFGTGINADSTHHAKVGFYVPPEFKTEFEQLEFKWLKVDYDIDPYNSQFGNATFTGTDPQVQNLSGNEDASVNGSSAYTQPGVGGSSGSTTPGNVAGVSVWSAICVWLDHTFSKSVGYMYQLIIGGPSLYTTRAVGLYMNVRGIGYTADRTVYFPSGSENSSNYSVGNNAVSAYTTGQSSSSNSSGYFRFYDDNWNMSYVTGTMQNVYEHTHGSHNHSDGSYYANDHLHDDGSFYAVNHEHPDGSYDINAADLSQITVGDSVGEAGSVNATGATIFLDFYNGTSWTNILSRTFSSDTLKTNVDMTNGGQYPDLDGYWRIRIAPNSANADFVNCKVRMKVKIDNIDN